MKRTVFPPFRQLFVACTLLMLVAIQTHGQSKLYSFTFRNCRLSDALQQLQQELQLPLVYNNLALDKYQVSLLTVTGNTREEILAGVLKDFPFGFHYNKVDNYFSIHGKKIKRRITIGGQVLDDQNEPLPRATIIGDSAGNTRSDEGGYFQLRSSATSVHVVVSMIGHIPLDTIVVSKQINLLRLRRQFNTLKEAGTIGLFPGDAGSTTAAVANAKDSADEGPLVLLADVISDEPGVMARPYTGLPSVNNAIEVRGHFRVDGATTERNSMMPQTNINGMPVPVTQSQLFNIATPMGNQPVGIDPMATLNLSDVGGIQILKDAMATAPLGTRGANGALLIATKEAHKQPPGFHLNVYQGVSFATRLSQLMNTPAIHQVRLAAFAANGLPPKEYDITGWGKDRSTNFPRALFGGPVGKTVLQVSQSWRGRKLGDQQLSGHHSAGLTVEQYPLPIKAGNSLASTYTNIDYRSGCTKINLSILGGLGQTTLPFLDPRPSQFLAPNAPVEKQRGKLVPTDSLGKELNPFGFQDSRYRASTWNLLSTLSLAWRPINPLFLTAQLGWSAQKTREHVGLPISALPLGASDKAMAVYASNYQRTTMADLRADYAFRLSPFKVRLSLGATFQSTRTSKELADSNYTSDQLLWAAFSNRLVDQPAQLIQYRYAGTYLGLTANYRNRFTLEANGRLDASSRFSPEKNPAFFGAIGAAWQLRRKDSTNEKRAVLNWLKVRTTWGITGSDGVGDYLYFANWVNYSNNTYGGQQGIVPQTAYRSDIQWMTIEKWNAGIDGKLLKGIYLTIDYYRNLSRNQFMRILLPGQTGNPAATDFDMPLKVLNTGLEFSLKSTFNLPSKITGTLQCAFTRPWNKLLQAPAAFLDLVPGQSLTTRWLFTFLGKDSNNLFRVKDYNGDGKITRQDDAKELRDREIRNYWSFSAGLTKGKFSCRFRLDGINQPQLTGLYRVYANGYPGSNLNGYLINLPVGATNWKGLSSPYQSPAIMPSLQQQRAVQYMLGSTASLEHVFSLTIRLVDLRYELPGRVAKKICAQRAQLYLQARNLGTLSPYKAGNPYLVDPTALPMIATAGLGIDITF